MAYLGLARQWRPQNFSDLIGQNHITRILEQSVRASRINHGYLFTGTRGIGKTSLSRIFAKLLRCQTRTQSLVQQGADSEYLLKSCGTCSDCVEIAAGRSVDVLEIDGASNNGVEAVREIRDNVKFLPSSGQFKIYIIDEVHMLTTAAFNALLKTLEEPPSHVIFIFATTDPQKIPATILSRCQRYDFRRASLKDISAQLKKICAAENLNIDDAAVNIIAREADGSVRDALSILDQVIAFGASAVTADLVAEALGLVSRSTVQAFLLAVVNQEPFDALKQVTIIYQYGHDFRSFLKDALDKIKQLVVAELYLEKMGPQFSQAALRQTLVQLYDLSDLEVDDLVLLTKKRSSEELTSIFFILNQALEEVSRSTLSKAILEIAVVQACDLKSQALLSAFQPAVVSSGVVSAPQQTTPLGVGVHTHRAGEAALASAAAVSGKAISSVAAVSASGNLSDLKAEWRKFIENVRKSKPLVASILENFALEKLTLSAPAKVVLHHSKDHKFYRDQLESKAYQDLLSQLLKSHFGVQIKVEYQEVVKVESVQSQIEAESKQAFEKKRQELMNSEAFLATKNLLGGRLDRFELIPPQDS